MNTIIIRLLVCIAVCASTIASWTPCPAAQENAAATNHAAILAPFLNDETFAVATIDLASIDVPAAVTSITTLLGLPENERQKATVPATMVKGVLDGLRTAGVQRIYLIGGLGDIHARGGPLAVIPLEARNRETVQAQIQSLVLMLQAMTGGGGNPAIKFERHASGVLIVGSELAVGRYSVRPSTDRVDLTAPLAKLTADGASVAAVVAPGSDARRVIRELWPTLQPPVANLTGQLIADRTKHFEASLKISANPSAHIALEANDVEAAATYQKSLEETRQLISQLKDRDAAQGLQLLLAALNLRTEGPRIVGDFSTAGQQAPAFSKMIAEMFDKAQEKGRRNQRAHNITQMMKGMLTHDSAKRSLPPAAIRDADGRALLSWRVAILPYIGQQALHSQFRLNEPWDSQHNITLVKRMPAVFADPDPKLAALVRDGKTMFQVPVGPDTIFFKNEGTRMSEITDGTSATIAVVEVVPERAVEWTKPADWEVDLQNPLAGVERSDRNGFNAARCDGSVAFYANETDATNFRALLTRAGANKEPLPK